MEIKTIQDAEREIAAAGSVHAMVLHITKHGPWDGLPGPVLAHILGRLAREMAEMMAAQREGGK